MRCSASVDFAFAEGSLDLARRLKKRPSAATCLSAGCTIAAAVVVVS